MRTINISAGHNPAGMVACGAVGFLDESVENRRVLSLMLPILVEMGWHVRDMTCNTGTSQQDVLNKCIDACNASNADVNMQLHFNSSSSKTANGCECWVYDENSKLYNLGIEICNQLNLKLGLKNRGVKTSKKLAFLRRTKQPAIIVEVCFVTNENDSFSLYNDELVSLAVTTALNNTFKAEITQVQQTPQINNSLSWYDIYQFRTEMGTLLHCKYPKDPHEILSKTPTISKTTNSKHITVWAVQKRLTYLGYDVGGIDGVFGLKTETAIKRFQSIYMKTPDGVISSGKRSWRKLLEME